MELKEEHEPRTEPTFFPTPSSMAANAEEEEEEEEQEEKEDDDQPTLSPFALEALRQFLAEQSEIPTAGVGVVDGENDEEETVALLQEDWRLSQFWYSPDTAHAVAQEVLSLFAQFHEPLPSVACISCPTLFAYLKKKYPDVSVQLLEYDKRFEQYGMDFTFYDYNQPEELPQAMKHTYQIVVADPPYLSEECLEKVAQTIAFLSQPGKSFLLLLTGDVQRDHAARRLGMHPCGFRPQHSSKLGNEFRLFTNYDPGERLGGWELEE